MTAALRPSLGLRHFSLATAGGEGSPRHTEANPGDGTIVAGPTSAAPQCLTAAEILARPKYIGGSWFGTRMHWTATEGAALRILADAKADLEKSADALGRSPTSIAHRARDTGLTLPPAWAALIAPKRKLLVRAEPKIALAYPFIIKKRDEHADLLAVNSLVPRWLPGREDVCQEIMLALWEGKITVDQLRANKDNLRGFIRDFTKANYEAGGHSISLHAPRGDGDDRMLIDSLADDPGRLWIEPQESA